MLHTHILQRFPFTCSADPARVSRGPLVNSTNVPRRIKKPKEKQQTSFTLPLSSKAAATVSLSNASAVGTASSGPNLPHHHSRNLIPFPASANFPCSSPPELDLDLLSFVVVERDGEDGLGNQSSLRAATAWRIDLRRRRSQSCLVPSSFVCGPPSQDEIPLQLGSPKPAQPPRRPQSVTNGKPTKKKHISADKAAKRARKNKQQVADMQFVAMMHRSILCSMSGTREFYSGLNTHFGHSVSELDRQDDILAERLWASLRSQGLRPIPFEGAGARLAKTSEVTASVKSVSPESNITPSVRMLPPLSIPETTPPESRPTSSPTRAEPVPDVLTMPQLVATLILRHNDRRNTRVRSAPSARTPATQQPCSSELKPSSPLRQSTCMAHS